MIDNSSGAVHEGDHASTDADGCKDGFRYRVTGEDGRYRIDNIEVKAGSPCKGNVLTEIIEDLSGAYLDEVDAKKIDHVTCAKGGCCPKELARMVTDLQELLLD